MSPKGEWCQLEELFDRVAALDVGKAALTVCVRTPAARRRRSETRLFKTTVGSPSAAMSESATPALAVPVSRTSARPLPGRHLAARCRHAHQRAATCDRSSASVAPKLTAWLPTASHSMTCVRLSV